MNDKQASFDFLSNIKSTTEIVRDRFESYEGEKCWQFHIREHNLKEDLRLSNMTEEQASKITINDFVFSHVSNEDKIMKGKINDFIVRHEWLGKIPPFTCDNFIATYKNIISGVIIMSIPPQPAYSMFGEEAKTQEKLVCRGACISWSPKNLGSKLLMYSIRWMAQNTEARLFTSYSDPEAKELGTIYQACNFIYLGNYSGTPFLYFDPNHPKRGWVNDRIFRMPSMYKFFAKALNIEWKEEWTSNTSINREIIPKDIHARLKKHEHWYQHEFCKKRVAVKKHKYLYICGRNKKEQKQILERVTKRNPKLCVNGKLGLPYPKERGK